MNKLDIQDRLEYHINDIDHVSDIVVNFILKNINKDKSTIIELDGDMGYGKTTLISNICKKLGVKEKVSSPTFVYLNEYHIYQIDTDYKLLKLLKKLLNIIKDRFAKVNFSKNINTTNKGVITKIIHIDAYRIEKNFNINSLQLEKYLDDPKCLIFVEWKQKLLNYKTNIVVALEKDLADPDKRSLTISKLKDTI